MSERVISFFVPGKAQTAGSKRAFLVYRKRDNKPFPVVTDDNPKSRDWKGDVKRFASEYYQGPLLDGPLLLELTFYFTRPAFHSGAKGLKPSAPPYHIVKPDVLKLARGVEDALTSVIWSDDAQIVDEILHKRYVNGPMQSPGVRIEVGRL